MSVGQTPQTATRTSNSSGLMRGTGTVSSRRSFAPRYTTACMVFGFTNIGPIQPQKAQSGKAASKGDNRLHLLHEEMALKNRRAVRGVGPFGLWTLDLGPWTLDWLLDFR